MVQKLCEAVTERCELGSVRQRCQLLEQMVYQWRKRAQQLQKQVIDLLTVLSLCIKMSLQKLLLQIEFQLERTLREVIQLFQPQVAVVELQVLCKGTRIVQADSGSHFDSESRNKNEEIIPVNRLTQSVCTDSPKPATTIRTCTVKQRTFFAPVGAKNVLCLTVQVRIVVAGSSGSVQTV